MMLGLCSCNPGIFIERLEASEAEYALPFKGGSAEIALSHGDWEIERVAVNNIDVEMADGGIYESRFMYFCLSRPSDTKLFLDLERSTDPDPVLIDIHIANDFQSLCIPVKIEACQGYSFDRIEYGTVTEKTEGFEEAWAKTISTDQEVSVFDVRFGRWICFPAASVTSEDMPEAIWMDELLKYVDRTFNVLIPVPFPEIGARPECLDHTEFSYKETFIAMEQPSEKVTLSKEDNTIHMFWGYVEYKVPYTIWFTHPEGMPMSFNGELTSKTYDGRWRIGR